LLLLWAEIAAGEFRRLATGWLPRGILGLKLSLIALICVLIRVQRDLKCEITDPTDCTAEEPDPAAGKLIVRVQGTASGIFFGTYTLAIQKDGDPPIAGVVNYPGGGGSGSAPVVNGELGQINTTGLSDGAYTITLTVYPAGPGSSKTCTTTFNLLKVIVYISRVAKVPAISMAPTPNNANPFDPAAELRTPPGFGLVSVGGGMTMEGAAYIYECAGRKIKNYEIRYARVLTPGSEPAQPPTDAAIPATWPVANRVAPLPLEYTIPDEYQPWTRVGPAAMDLINSWKTMTIGATTYYKLNAGSWDSSAAGSGRFSLLLTAEDTTAGPHRYHDIQHVWFDNKPIIGQIVKFQWFNPDTGMWEDIPPCEDLSMKKFGKIRIMGLAWDPVIDEAWWPASAPNDNFGYYRLDYWKQFGATQSLTGNITTRVPALPALPPVPIPTAANAGELATWDLTSLDAGPIPAPYVPPPDPQIYRGESCTYILQLYVTDTTIVNEGTTHYTYMQVPVKIVNDL